MADSKPTHRATIERTDFFKAWMLLNHKDLRIFSAGTLWMNLAVSHEDLVVWRNNGLHPIMIFPLERPDA